MAKTTFYAQVEPEFMTRGWGTDKKTHVRSIKVARITQKRPEKPIGGTVLVKLTLDIPDEAFLPLEPEAVIRVPASLVEVNPISVEAEDPGRPEDIEDIGMVAT